MYDISQSIIAKYSPVTFCAMSVTQAHSVLISSLNFSNVHIKCRILFYNLSIIYGFQWQVDLKKFSLRINLKNGYNPPIPLRTIKNQWLSTNLWIEVKYEGKSNIKKFGSLIGSWKRKSQWDKFGLYGGCSCIFLPSFSNFCWVRAAGWQALFWRKITSFTNESYRLRRYTNLTSLKTS